jgi:1-acyl-sn-glycerol-3-phosphate acyltransferase
VAPTLRTEPVYRPVIGAFLTLFAVLRLRFRITGREHLPAQGGAVLVVSHFGYLEFGFVGAVCWWDHRRLIRFLAVKASFSHRLSGPLMRGMHHIPVDRSAGAAAYDKAVDALRSGELIGIFPEGGVSRSWTLKAFRTGAARMAAAAEVPIVPVVVWGGHRVLTKGRRPRLRDAIGTPISVIFGEPVYPTTSDDPALVTAKLHALMTALLDSAQRDYPEPPGRDPWWLPAHLGGSAPAPPPDVPPVLRSSVR